MNERNIEDANDAVKRPAVPRFDMIDSAADTASSASFNTASSTDDAVDDVMNEVKYYRSGEEVEMTVLRADNGEYKEVNLTVTLGTKDAISTLQTQ